MIIHSPAGDEIIRATNYRTVDRRVRVTPNVTEDFRSRSAFDCGTLDL